MTTKIGVFSLPIFKGNKSAGRHAARIRRITAAVLPLLGLMVHGVVAAQQCQWDERYPELLGISAEPEPAGTPAVEFVNAVVTEPERLAEKGLYAVKSGDTVKLLCVGENLWRIKHYATGLSIVFSTVPP